MANRSDRTTDFAVLFETITGQSTITEHQRTEIPVRLDAQNEESAVAEYVDATATAPGFDDVIDDPEPY